MPLGSLKEIASIIFEINNGVMKKLFILLIFLPLIAFGQSSDDHLSLFIILSILGSIVGLVILLYLIRWIFAIDKRVKQNEQIINLLKLLSEKAEISKDEIKKAINI